jgi:hypothetical protein
MEIRTHLSKIGASGCERLSKYLYEAIQYAITRVDYYESARSQALGLGLGLIIVASSLGVTTFSFYTDLEAGHVHQRALCIAILAFLLVLALAGLITVLRHGVQSRYKYPFRKHAKIARWFHRYLISDKTDFGDSYLHVLCSGIHEWIENSKDIENTAIENAEQLLCLFYIQKRKEKCVRELINIITTGLTISLCVSVIVFIIMTLYFSGIISLT